MTHCTKSNHSDTARSLAQALRQFVDTHIIPAEAELAKGDESSPLIKQLNGMAREAGLWGLFYPLSHGGQIASLEDYLLVAEQEGRTEFSQAIFGSHSALDAHILLKFGTEALQQQFLQPLTEGLAVSAYGMTEPDHGGSFPSLISTSAQLVNGQWIINGRKWFVCNTERATFVTVLVRTGAADVPIHQALSMIIVPTSTAGFKVERQISLLGRHLGQGEMSFTNVQVPEAYLLGDCGAGIALMGKRLNTGRLLRSMNWVGLAQRCCELMGARIHSERGVSSRFLDKQLVRQHLVTSHHAISSARELIRLAARGVDAGYPNDVDINIAKMAASQAICTASDSAMQLYGAEGISELTPIEGIYRIARTSRILDGSDEALISSVGRKLMDCYQDGGRYHFD